MYALHSTDIGSASASSAAYSSSHPRFQPATSVWRITVRVSSDGSSASVSRIFRHSWSDFGTTRRRYTSSFGAATVTYSCVGSCPSAASLRSTEGVVPFVTRNVVIPRAWYPSIISPRRR